jgi:hypothetical protein
MLARFVIRGLSWDPVFSWIPASAGMTSKDVKKHFQHPVRFSAATLKNHGAPRPVVVRFSSGHFGMAFSTSNRGQKKLDFDKWISACKGDERLIQSIKNPGGH